MGVVVQTDIYGLFWFVSHMTKSFFPFSVSVVWFCFDLLLFVVFGLVYLLVLVGVFSLVLFSFWILWDCDDCILAIRKLSLNLRLPGVPGKMSFWELWTET